MDCNQLSGEAAANQPLDLSVTSTFRCTLRAPNPNAASAQTHYPTPVPSPNDATPKSISPSPNHPSVSAVVQAQLMQLYQQNQRAALEQHSIPPHQPARQPNSPRSISRTPSISPTINSASRTVRPFKALPSDPLALAPLDDANYREYRQRVLELKPIVPPCNPKMRRSKIATPAPANVSSATPATSSSTPDHIGSGSESVHSTTGAAQQKDAAYLERRRKNNIAAKRSRDRRRNMEDEIATNLINEQQLNTWIAAQMAINRQTFGPL